MQKSLLFATMLHMRNINNGDKSATQNSWLYQRSQNC